MRRWKKWTLISLGALVAAAAAFIVPTVWFKPYSVNHSYARVFVRFALQSPMLLSQLGFGHTAHHIESSQVVNPAVSGRYLVRS